MGSRKKVENSLLTEINTEEEWGKLCEWKVRVRDNICYRLIVIENLFATSFGILSLRDSDNTRPSILVV